ncbi:MAG: hypothetical protein ACE37F_27950 [Nannocystaceae bacterium]|nr:hypothetical protein [bacterium]
MRASILVVSLSAMALLGCPAEVKDTNAAPAPKPEVPQVDESDPRVVKVGDDLYAAEALPEPEPTGKAKGSGKPDESNGYCRLYAPKLPEPHCCRTEYGFDAEATGEACGKPLYLGESFQRSCGYFFHDPQSGTPQWFRTSFVQAESPKAAAEAEASRIEARLGGKVTVEPMQDTPEAYMLEYNDIAYAYMSGDPGWPNVRRLAWKTGTCSDEGLEKVVAQMSTAKPPAKGAERQGLVPKAR